MKNISNDPNADMSPEKRQYTVMNPNSFLGASFAKGDKFMGADPERSV